MTPLNCKSILDCDELETRIHQAEMEKISLTLLDLPNYDCDITVTFEDDYHKKVNFPLFYESNLHRALDFVENQDIKNGVDAFVTTDKELAFLAYGQHYTVNGEDDILKSLITIKSWNESHLPIDMARVFGVSKETEKEKGVEHVTDLS
ncbi:hypothetical protein [Streptococcus loxodontisalivarius]|uniref:Uncharacterized protein n=1 Tax=Streptococcus loxodontisalivarius TaxID=1349415 RepID=A0ABS2PPR5_9STRE|nr:hypothetical protein [Streptococcus loxodontisalivarius]MBM7642033.1 hypothetical protein [Streptococcus loxodontisalivarius]